MSEWNCKLFYKDISTMDYIELSNWIIACRSYLVKDTYNSREEYLEILELFFLEWQEHYKQNETIYKSEKYKKALLFCSLRDRLKFIVNFNNGKDNGIIEANFYNYKNIFSDSIFVEKVEEEIKVVSSDYFMKISNIFIIGDFEMSLRNETEANKKQKLAELLNKEDKKVINGKRSSEDLKELKIHLENGYKNYLHNEIISKQTFSEIETVYKVYKGKRALKTLTYKELVDLIKSNSELRVEKDKRKRKAQYSSALEECGVTSTTYGEFINDYMCQKGFEKKFFINLAFAIGLPYSYCEKLLKYNGFTLNAINRIFEDICSNAFKLGCSREMVIDIIEKKNNENKDSAEKRKIISKNKKLQYGEIPNLNKNRKQGCKF